MLFSSIHRQRYLTLAGSLLALVIMDPPYASAGAAYGSIGEIRAAAKTQRRRVLRVRKSLMRPKVEVREAGGWFGFCGGGGLTVGIAKVRRDGRTQLRIVGSASAFEPHTFFAAARFGFSVHGAGQIARHEIRKPVGAVGAVGLGGEVLQGTRGTSPGNRGVYWLVGLGFRAGGLEERWNRSFPLTGWWKSGNLKKADRTLSLLARVERELDSAGHAKSGTDKTRWETQARKSMEQAMHIADGLE